MHIWKHTLTYVQKYSSLQAYTSIQTHIIYKHTYADIHIYNPDHIQTYILHL